MACPLSWTYQQSLAVTRTASDLEENMRYIAAPLAIIIAIMGVIVLLPALPFIACAGIFLVIAAGFAEISKRKKGNTKES